MTALISARSLIEKGVEIKLLESRRSGIIGVGEGSTPWLRGFFDSLGIEEAEWNARVPTRPTNAHRLRRAGRQARIERSFHPFASMLDNLTMKAVFHQCRGADQWRGPARAFRTVSSSPRAWPPTARAPKARENLPFDIWHGYHFDAVLLGQFLHKKALERGGALQELSRDSRNARRRWGDRLGRHPGGRVDRGGSVSSIAPALLAS